jgi:hypothetical protein
MTSLELLYDESVGEQPFLYRLNWGELYGVNYELNN